MKASSLVRLYPRPWRERYGAELEALVASQEIAPRMVFDILLGALDAHLAPQSHVAGAAKGAGGGGRVMELLKAGCGAPAMSRAEQIRYALIVVGAALGLTLLFVGLKRTVGPNVWIEALGAPMGSVAPLLYVLVLMREHSLRVRIVVTGGLFVVVYAIGLVAAWT